VADNGDDDDDGDGDGKGRQECIIRELAIFWTCCRYCLILENLDEMATRWRCQDDNGICLPLICLQIILIFEVWLCQFFQTGQCGQDAS
jgi:hypothetical protein